MSKFLEKNLLEIAIVLVVDLNSQMDLEVFP